VSSEVEATPALRDEEMSCADILRHLPSNHMDIQSLLSLVDVPSQCPDTASKQAIVCFSHLRPTESLSGLFRHHVMPPTAWVNDARASLAALLSEDIQSVEHFEPPLAGGPSQRWPLEAINIWDSWLEVQEHRTKWAECIAWARLHSTNDEEAVQFAKEIADVLGHISWKNPLTVLNARGLVPISGVRQLLSDRWISDDIIQMLLEWMRIRANSSGTATSGAFICNLHFQTAVRSCQKSGDFNSTYLKRIHKLVEQSKHTHLYTILHVNDNHWIALCIDFQRKTIAHGSRIH
jgi:hypothetical protein